MFKMVKRYFLEVSFLKGKISEIIQKTASVLYKRGLSMFDAEMQQHLLSMCALGKISELYENDELRQKAENCFLKGWFHSEKTDAIEKNLLSVENIKTELKSHEYLIFIFYGISKLLSYKTQKRNYFRILLQYSIINRFYYIIVKENCQPFFAQRLSFS